MPNIVWVAVRYESTRVTPALDVCVFNTQSDAERFIAERPDDKFHLWVRTII